MMKRMWMPATSVLAAVLLLSSCASNDAADASEASEPPETTDAPTVDAEDPAEDHAAPAAGGSTASESAQETFEPRGGQDLFDGPDGAEFFSISAAEDDGSLIHHLQCQDEEALAEKAAHNNGAQPLGWPQEWDGSGAMPDPLCHPDYLDISEWEDLDAHFACWEGIETSTTVGGSQTQAEVDEILWQQSEARAEWEHNPPGGTCAEQWAAHRGTDPGDYADAANADDGGTSSSSR